MNSCAAVAVLDIWGAFLKDFACIYGATAVGLLEILGHFEGSFFAQLLLQDQEALFLAGSHPQCRCGSQLVRCQRPPQC